MLCAALQVTVAYAVIVIYAVHYRRLHQGLRFGLSPAYSRLDGLSRSGKPAQPVFVRRMYLLSMGCAVGLPLAAALAWPAKGLFEVAAYALSDCSALPRDEELTSMTGLRAITGFTFTNVGKGRCGRKVELWGRETIDDLWFTVETPLIDEQLPDAARVTERSTTMGLGEPLRSKDGVVGVCGAVLRADVNGSGLSSAQLQSVLTLSRDRLLPRCPLGASRSDVR